jgi:AGZA family xanthine/uracil permease-like MFS transporter
VFVVGLTISAALVARKVRGALLIGILASTVVAIIVNEINDGSIWRNGIAQIPSKIVDTPTFARSGTSSFGFISVLGTATALRGGAP